MLATMGRADHAAILTPILPGDPTYRITFVLLAVVAVLGVVWELIYHVIQQFRWEKDWPTLFGFITCVNEGLLIIVLLKADLVPGLGVDGVRGLAGGVHHRLPGDLDGDLGLDQRTDASAVHPLALLRWKDRVTWTSPCTLSSPDRLGGAGLPPRHRHRHPGPRSAGSSCSSARPTRTPSRRCSARPRWSPPTAARAASWCAASPCCSARRPRSPRRSSRSPRTAPASPCSCRATRRHRQRRDLVGQGLAGLGRESSSRGRSPRLVRPTRRRATVGPAAPAPGRRRRRRPVASRSAPAARRPAEPRAARRDGRRRREPTDGRGARGHGAAEPEVMEPEVASEPEVMEPEPRCASGPDPGRARRGRRPAATRLPRTAGAAAPEAGHGHGHGHETSTR